jgi:signal transduction histidine kinase
MKAQVLTQTRIRQSLERLPADVHSCLIYESLEDQLAAVVPFIQTGLERGEKCLYLGQETNIANLIPALRKAGIAADEKMASGALTVMPTSEAIPGCAEQTLAMLRTARVMAGAESLTPVRLIREIASRQGELIGQQELAEAEENIAACFAGQNYVDLVQFNSRELAPQDLLNVIRTHEVIIWNGTVCDNLHAGTTEERLAPEPTSQEVDRVLANLRDRQLAEDNLREAAGSAVLLPVESLLTGAPAPKSHSGCGTCLTQIGKLQEQISHAQKMEALALMATGMVHEFRNKLATIQGCAEMLMENLDRTDKRAFLAQRILDAGNSCALLTNNLLAFGRPARTRAEVLDVNSELLDFEDELRETAPENVTLRIVPSPAPCPVKIDTSQLEQVLVNLLCNACDAMPNGGTITITTAIATLRGEDVTEYPGLRAGSYVALSFTDTGIGIAPVAQKRVFEPFFTSKEPGRGLGLGLSIVHGIVQNHFRGAISLQSVPAAGTTFTIYIPLANQA